MTKATLRDLLLFIGVPIVIVVTTATALWYNIDPIRSYLFASVARVIGDPVVEVDAEDTSVTIKQTLSAQPPVHPHSPPVVVKTVEKRVVKINASKHRILCNQAVYKGTAQCSR